jgi:hypothetical protein
VSERPRSGSSPTALPSPAPSTPAGTARPDADALALTEHWLVQEARSLAERLLADLGRRWQHTVGVAARAVELAPAVVRADQPLLVAAAWSHDIGYAARLRRTGFHPLDGACHLRGTPWGGPLAGLVAHHSGARYVASARGLDAEMRAFADPRFTTGRLADALTTADQTTDPDGRPVDVETRLADVLRRHGPDSPQARVHHLRAPAVRAAVARTDQRLLASHLAAALA